jgi:hypothetical protein
MPPGGATTHMDIKTTRLYKGRNVERLRHLGERQKRE